MKWELIIFMIIVMGGLASAFTLEQKIDIVMQTHTTSSITWTPTNGDLGIVEWNNTAYSDISEIYFELVGDYDYNGITDGGGSGSVELYDFTNATNISESVIALGSFSTLLRSGNITYFFNNSLINVTVQLKSGNNSTDTKVSHARLVIVQNGNITKTRTYIPVGSSQSVSSEDVVPAIGRPLTEIGRPKRWIWNVSDFPLNNATYYFHSTFYVSFGTGRALVDLYPFGINNETKRLNTTSTSPVYLRGQIFNGTLNNTLIDGKTYSVGLQSNGTIFVAVTALIRNAYIVIDQNINFSNPKTLLIYQVVNNYNSTSLTTPVTNDIHQNQLNYTNLAGVNLNYTADRTLSHPANYGAFFQLRHISNNITNSDYNTSSISYIYSTSNVDAYNFAGNGTGLLTAFIWTNDSSSGATQITNARLIVRVNGITTVSSNTCTYSSGTWNVLCSDNCNITSNVNLQNNTLNLTGTGTELFYVNARIFNYSEIIHHKCESVITTLGGYG